MAWQIILTYCTNSARFTCIKRSSSSKSYSGLKSDNVRFAIVPTKFMKYSKSSWSDEIFHWLNGEHRQIPGHSVRDARATWKHMQEKRNTPRLRIEKQQTIFHPHTSAGTHVCLVRNAMHRCCWISPTRSIFILVYYCTKYIYIIYTYIQNTAKYEL